MGIVMHQSHIFNEDQIVVPGSQPFQQERDIPELPYTTHYNINATSPPRVISRIPFQNTIQQYQNTNNTLISYKANFDESFPS